jgi:uncharacterized protein (TIGR02246 family)
MTHRSTTRRNAASTVGWLAVLLVGLALPTVAQHVKTPPAGRLPAPAGSVAALLEEHDEAMNRHDLDAIMALFASGEKTTMMGTGPGERWAGKDEIRTAYTELFKDFDTGSMSHRCAWKIGDVKGDLAWGAASCTMTDARGEQKRSFGLNVSGVAEKEGGRWLFRALHFSNLTGLNTPPATQPATQ